MAGWSSLSTRQKVALALGVSAGAAVLCICYAKYRSGRALAAPGSKEDDHELRLKIPRNVVRRLLGGGDDVIGQLSKQTAAHMEVSQLTDSDGHSELTIRGNHNQVHRAQELLSTFLQNDNMLVELHLPAQSVSRIIGQGGQRIRDISRTSGAKIQYERQPENSFCLSRCITITGSREQVEAAKVFIQKLAEDEASILKRAADSSKFRAHRKEIIATKKRDRQPPYEECSTPNTDHSPDSFHTADSPEERPAEGAEAQNMSDNTSSICKFEVPSPDFNFHAGEYVDVCVSASENPEHFWIQILGSRSSQLDKLTLEMSDFYQKQKQDKIPEIRVGDIVAARFRDDNFWYRAEVLNVLENGSVDLYYVDYGDNWVCPKENLFPLRSDFLSLPFQAVECGLANISPNGEKWSEEALDTFDSLSHCASWSPLLAKIVSFPSPGASHFQIHLYDSSRDPMLDIGKELVRRRLAIKRRTSSEKADDETVVSELLEEVINLSKKPEPPSFTSRQEEVRRLESEVFLNSSADEVIVVEDQA
uniref:Tudor domain-containing protein n=1 Tax=Pyxicephalus adspersus TaxID=30357 RepID=A0AAV2ZKC6_PYXAD|nr:TPA: hypothetical protein GDO54_004889 [Pyxicephalus adspersus]